MSGFTIERSGFTKLHGTSGFPGELGLAQQLMTDLQAAGFTKVHPSNTITGDTSVAVFDSSPAVDPLAGQEQGWRIRIESKNVSPGTGIHINIATKLQIPSDGTAVARHDTNRTSGHLIGTPGGGTNHWNTAEVPFINMSQFYPNTNEDPSSAPLSYRLSVSDHGVMLCVWKQARDDTGDMFAWFVAQRPVDPADGSVLTEHYAPVFCMYGNGGSGGHFYSINGADIDNLLDTMDSSSQSFIATDTVRTRLASRAKIANPNTIRKFVVRETDVIAPTPSVTAVTPTRDSNAIINPMEQVSISVENKYMITFPSGLNTQRRAYKHELDMIAYTSADVISQDSEVNVTVFGEQTPRTYKAMQANGPFNTGMRILMLTAGGGITGTPPADPED